MKKFTTTEVRNLLNQVMREDISFSEMVEILNERVSEAEELCVEDIPKRKFKKGDKVRIKHGVSSKTHRHIFPSFMGGMDELIEKELTVDVCANGIVCIEESGYNLHEDWLETYAKKLKKGDLAIFWDSDKGSAFIGEYNCFLKDVKYPHRDNRGDVWVNAIKFESIEQYRKLLKGEI